MKVTGTNAPNAKQWTRNPEPLLGQDKKGVYVQVLPGNTPGDIALYLKQRGLKIPRELEDHYFAKNDPSRPHAERHEGNLRVGKRFYVPADQEADQGAPLPGWLRAKPQTWGGQKQWGPQVKATGVTSAPVAGGVSTPSLRTLVESGKSVPLSQLQSALVDDLSKLPPSADRKAVATELDAYVRAHRDDMGSSSASSHALYEKQLSIVGHMWAENPGVLKDRTALWSDATAATQKALGR